MHDSVSKKMNEIWWIGGFTNFAYIFAYLVIALIFALLIYGGGLIDPKFASYISYDFSTNEINTLIYYCNL